MDVSDEEAVRFGDNGSKTVYESDHEGIVKGYKNLRAHLHVNSYHTYPSSHSLSSRMSSLKK
jgi:hypothetical protein